jgi:hypothetical protein
MLDGTRWTEKEGTSPWKIAYGVLSCVLLVATSWSLGHSKSPVPPPILAPQPPAEAQPAMRKEKRSQPISGRRLTEERMARRSDSTRRFEEQLYGISLDSPQGYEIKQGELPDMDTGLGYLGAIPMEFAGPGGVRVVTIEAPARVHLGTDLVNAFLTVSVFPDSSEELCTHFSPELDQNQPSLKRTISGITFTGIPNSEAANMHEYFGKYYHGYSEGACYEVGYGIVTASAGTASGLKQVDGDALLRRLDKIVDTISITPQATENGSERETASKTAGSN